MQGGEGWVAAAKARGWQPGTLGAVKVGGQAGAIRPNNSAAPLWRDVSPHFGGNQRSHSSGCGAKGDVGLFLSAR